MSARPSAVSLVDSHSVDIDAGREVAWRALLRMIEGAGPGPLARFLGCVDTEASGPRPMAAGSTVPGFHVVDVEVPAELALVQRDAEAVSAVR